MPYSTRDSVSLIQLKHIHMKHTKYPLLILLTFLTISCGKKAPNAGSADVEELAGGMALNVLGFHKWAFNADDYEYELRNIIKKNVDHEAQKTDFSFQLNLKKKGDKEWIESRAQFNATAYYTEEGELYVELKR